ncbi:hypothetical protein OG901_40225 [Streptomyces mirabilis]|uniref:NosD domain-containing protein n=1 Tax=Streptomyces mirabilis TaxID=68239 RepID=UPI00224F2791|nr:NosD domain-containing protein [Streptomyces mirabilis]MCX5353896.1 hypothetical protein [Streptomyces mirabilis]
MNGNTVTDSLYDGIAFSTSTNTLLQDNTVSNPGRNGIAISPSYYPAPTGSATITGNIGVAGLAGGLAGGEVGPGGVGAGARKGHCGGVVGLVAGQGEGAGVGDGDALRGAGHVHRQVGEGQ